MVVAAVSGAAVGLEQVASTVRQNDRDLSVAVERNGPDDALLAKVSEVGGDL